MSSLDIMLEAKLVDIPFKRSELESLVADLAASGFKLEVLIPRAMETIGLFYRSTPEVAVEAKLISTPVPEPTPVTPPQPQPIAPQPPTPPRAIQNQPFNKKFNRR